jgi:hypothetical protein
VQALVLAFIQRVEQTKEWKPESLLEYLERIFNDPNKAKKAGQKLKELHQGTALIATFVPIFKKSCLKQVQINGRMMQK